MRKIENDAAAFVRTIALERGRNAEWAEKAVRESVSITEREAVKLKVVDLIADSVPDLLEKIDGRTVKTAKGRRDARRRGARGDRPIEIGFRDRFLNVITDPNVAYILMMLGMLGLFFELSNPGVILPGVIGGISLILAFFAFQSLPINYAGLLLILFGIVLLHRRDQDREPRRPGHRRHRRDGARLADALRRARGRLPRVVVGDRADGRRHRRRSSCSCSPPACARSARSAVDGAGASWGRPGVAREPLGPEGQVLVAGRAVAGGRRGRPRRGGRAGPRGRRERAHTQGREGEAEGGVT